MFPLNRETTPGSEFLIGVQLKCITPVTNYSLWSNMLEQLSVPFNVTEMFQVFHDDWDEIFIER